jgi:hypothetical protein
MSELTQLSCGFREALVIGPFGLFSLRSERLASSSSSGPCYGHDQLTLARKRRERRNRRERRERRKLTASVTSEAEWLLQWMFPPSADLKDRA